MERLNGYLDILMKAVGKDDDKEGEVRRVVSRKYVSKGQRRVARLQT